MATPDTQTRDTQTQLIEVTEAAANKLREAVTKANPENLPGYGIRLGVAGGGCAGLQYDMAPAAAAENGDITEEHFGLLFFLHPMVLPYIKGTRLDFSDSLMDGGFKFQNPNAASSCGCGTSFGL